MYFFYFYPLGLDRGPKRLPLLSWTLTTVMLVAFVWLKYFSYWGPVRPWELVFHPGNGAPWTALTALFLHGSWWHLLGNLIYFHVFAPPLEDRLGPMRFGVILLVMGVFGNLIHGFVSVVGMMGQGGLGVLGFSGAIAGLLSFCLIRFHDSSVDVGWWIFAPLIGQNRAGRTRVPMLAAVGSWLLLQVVQALVASESGAAISFGAHLGGFAMGLILAAALGQFEKGRSEAIENRARRYFLAGHFYASAGAWTEYLEREPEDLEAWLGLARALQFSGRTADAIDYYRRAFHRLLDEGKVAEALAVHAEAGRGPVRIGFGPSDTARAAYYYEKQMDYTRAVDAYRQLYESYPQHPDGQRALVRIIELYRGKLLDMGEARRWYREAVRSMPPGQWREYLEQEISSAAMLCEDAEEDLLASTPVSGS